MKTRKNLYAIIVALSLCCFAQTTRAQKEDSTGGSHRDTLSFCNCSICTARYLTVIAPTIKVNPATKPTEKKKPLPTPAPKVSGQSPRIKEAAVVKKSKGQ
ncbi:MAG TPA: hypothetical protein VD993_11050 [Chitinophagaceae bacterium]|nr:hypothetical protein [Chitinophagaceae bacterium]